MTVEQYFQQQQALRDMTLHPVAFVLQLNGIYYAKAEYSSPVAIFDTKEQAKEYYQKCRFPKELGYLCAQKHGRKMVHNFRPDTPLWEYNPPDDAGEVWVDVPAIFPAVPWSVYRQGDGSPLLENPEPPGDVIAIPNLEWDEESKAKIAKAIDAGIARMEEDV